MDNCEICKKCGTTDCIGTADGCYEPAPENKAKSEQLQHNLITQLDNYPEDLIDALCDVVNEYYK